MTAPQEEAAKPAAAEEPDTSRPPPVFLAFQGGGARGIAHVGGLNAVNELGLEVIGVAGTSAGAIMAALAAARYKATELLDHENKTHLLQTVDNGRFKVATSLFSPAGWRRIRRLRSLSKALGPEGKLARLWKQWPWRAIVAADAAIVVAVAFVAAPRAALATVAALLAFGVWGGWRLLHGMASLEQVRRLIDVALAEKLGGSFEVTFEDLRERKGLPLKLVATNVSGEKLELFSVETTPKVKVADAVAASICLPVIFEPWKFSYASFSEGVAEERQFVDGGILSNLPAWTFDEDRSLRPDAVTIAFGLQAQKSASKSPHWLPAALHTVVAGPPQVHFRGIDRMIHIPLPSTIRVLDFDAAFGTLAENVARAEEVATANLQRHLTDVPAAIRQTLRDMQAHISGELCAHFPKEFGRVDRATPLIRIALAIQKPSEHISLSVAYEVGHDGGRRGSRIMLASSSVGQAWTEDGPGYYIFGAGNDRARFYPDSEWSALLPVIDPDMRDAEEGTGPTPGELAVVAIVDSAEPIPDTIMSDEGHLEDFWVTLSDAAVGFIDVHKVGRLFRRSIAWL